MSAGIAPDGPHTGLSGLCEDIRGALAEWVPGMLGVHVHRSVSGPAEVARLVGAVVDAAEITVLPGDGATARAELHAVAARALAAAGEQPGTDVRVELGVDVLIPLARTVVAWLYRPPHRQQQATPARFTRPRIPIHR
ncbi:hypothetical protein OG280_41020 (plasmid) [Streptomyces virginiae]|uniref:hypothetical protein n=1 Tax=Streptomyces virginiae TaxID=1961 RepID=UPI002DDC897E|nr:hypothetical protein [Streptomyces virginiae]WSC82723.1 hypothetical protein OHA56_41240 [Streptomyces virginiae]